MLTLWLLPSLGLHSCWPSLLRQQTLKWLRDLPPDRSAQEPQGHPNTKARDASFRGAAPNDCSVFLFKQISEDFKHVGLTRMQDIRIIWGLKSSCIPHGREEGKKNPLFKKPLNTGLNGSTALLKGQSPTLQKQTSPNPFAFLHVLQETLLLQASKNKNNSVLSVLGRQCFT